MGSGIHGLQLVLNITAFSSRRALLRAHALDVVMLITKWQFACQPGRSEGQLGEPCCDMLKIYLTLVKSVRGQREVIWEEVRGNMSDAHRAPTPCMHGKGAMTGGAKNRRNQFVECVNAAELFLWWCWNNEQRQLLLGFDQKGPVKWNYYETLKPAGWKGSRTNPLSAICESKSYAPASRYRGSECVNV